jgi:hypothetical protein
MENQPLQDPGRLELSFNPEPVAACAVEHFNPAFPQDYFFGGAICSKLLIFREIFRVVLDRKTSNV